MEHTDRAATPPPTMGPLAAGAQAAVLVALGAAAGWRGGRRTGAGAGGALVLAAAVPYGVAVARHRPYPRSRRGLFRWWVDGTWSAPNTVAGAIFYVHQRLVGNRDVTARSRGSGTVWLRDPAIAGYATTVGIVKAGSHDRVDAHEDVHVLQARLLGPLYLPLVALGYVLATVAPVWWRRHDHAAAPIDSLRAYFHRGVYRHVWHERWAYSATAAVAEAERPAPRGPQIRSRR